MTARLCIALILCSVLVAGCGNKADLRPRANTAPPIAPAGSARAETPKQQTTPDAESKPARSDELLKRSEERQTDDFDLPPPG